MFYFTKMFITPRFQSNEHHTYGVNKKHTGTSKSHISRGHGAGVVVFDAYKVIEAPVGVLGIVQSVSDQLDTSCSAVHAGVCLLQTMAKGESNADRQHCVALDLVCAGHFLLAGVEYLGVHVARTDCKERRVAH